MRDESIKVNMSVDDLHSMYHSVDLQIYTLMGVARGAKLRGDTETVKECVSWARAANWLRVYVYQILRRGSGIFPRSMQPMRREWDE